MAQSILILQVDFEVCLDACNQFEQLQRVGEVLELVEVEEHFELEHEGH